MEDKIKIYVPESVNNILLKDNELFEIYKKDGNLNRNEFYNLLIINFYQQFQKTSVDTITKIKQSISKNINCSDDDINHATMEIIKHINGSSNQLGSNHLAEVSLSLKPTKKSSDIISFIQTQLLYDDTLSGYFRKMFTSYTMLPQDKRERIIFKENFTLIEEAIKNNQKIFFSTVKSSRPHIVSPYAIASSKEELFNYLVCEQQGTVKSYRMCRIRKAIIMNEQAVFKSNNIELFNKMINQGPQYAYKTKTEDSQIKVYLSEKGKDMYKAIYLHRPKYTKFDDNIYYFDCSEAQAMQYFTKFGRDAIVIEPASLAANINKFYSLADKAYKKYYKNHEILISDDQ